ncbi:MAG: glycosyltransferase family 2 protein [Candidatus Levybacteria bacterium]|nr:glycosyltransferase family 2 protein [Candidatus Levybacteria bacterium]
MKLPLTLIVPAKKEEEAVIHTLEKIKERVKINHKVIVVNDSFEGDKTGEIVKKYAEKNKNVSVVINRNNPHPTFASALILGFDKVKDGVAIPIMADLCDRLEDIEIMYKKIHEGWDIVCGSRYIRGGGKKGGPLIQSVGSFLICSFLHYVTGIPTTDVSNAFKMYRKNVLEKAIIHPRSGVEASMAITLQAYFDKAKITEIPTRWIGRTLGNSKFKIIERTPPYYKICVWAVKNTIRKYLHLKPLKYNIDY